MAASASWVEFANRIGLPPLSGLGTRRVARLASSRVRQHKKHGVDVL